MQSGALNVDKIPVLKTQITQSVTSPNIIYDEASHLISAKAIDITEFNILYLKKYK